jgi:hypothetical protein
VAVAELPDSEGTPVLRADFSDDVAWQRLKQEIEVVTASSFGASVEFVDGQSLVGLNQSELASRFPRVFPRHYPHPVAFVADTATISTPDHPLLVINLLAGDPTGPFRTVPERMLSIVDNLSISNLNYFEYARAVDPDGVFRGF